MALDKQFVKIKYNNKLIFVGEVESGSSEEYLTLKSQSESNLLGLMIETDQRFKELAKRCDYLEKELKKIKGEE